MFSLYFDNSPQRRLPNLPEKEGPNAIRQQARCLIDFFECLPLPIKTCAPHFNGNDVIAQADSIRSWMSHSKEIQTLQSLDLTDSRLTHVPPEIGLFHHLTELILADNQLESLPAEIGNLVNLTTLDLSDNQLTVLPAEIGNLVGLTKLDLTSNELKAIPPEIGNLVNLKDLSCSQNRLKSLPAQIGNLVNLTEFYLANNQLESLPIEIGNLVKLISLALGDNGLESLPVEIGHLVNLTELGLTNNQLNSLPAEIGNLVKLTHLVLTDNRLEELPAQIGNLAALTLLLLRNNQLKKLPDEIGGLAALTELDLSNNQLTALPAEIERFAALKKLNLSDNQLTALPAEIGRLTLLKEFYLKNNQLKDLPAEIGNLAALKKLQLNGNQLKNLPAAIGDLASLTELYLNENQLEDLPAEIGNLAALKMLYLIHNQLESLPAQIGGLVTLTRIFVRGNRFEFSPPEIAHLRHLQCDLPPPPQIMIAPLQAWSSEFERAFPQNDPINAEYWNSRTTDFAPLESLPVEENKTFTDYLTRLEETYDYQSGGQAQKNVILRVERMVQLACKNPEFKYLTLAAIAEGLESCGDRVLMTFNEIEILWQFHHKELTDDEFKSLAIRVSRYHCLTRYAKKFAQDRDLRDVVETTLFYHIELREALDLPITTGGMLYPDMAGVSPEMLEKARVYMMYYSDEYLLEQSGYWKDRMATKHAALVEEISLKYLTLLEAVEEYCNCDEKNDWLEAHQDPELRKILQETKGNYDVASRLIMDKRGKALAQLDASAAAAQEV